jgi:hypothetical protein
VFVDDGVRHELDRLPIADAPTVSAVLWTTFAMKASVDALIRLVAPAVTALAHAPWWTVAGVFVLVLAHRVLPLDSKDLLTLWLRIIPDNQGREGREDQVPEREGGE